MRKIMAKLNENIFNNQRRYAFSLVSICLMGFVFIMYKVDLEDKILQYASHKSNQNDVQMVHDFTSGMEIRQKFRSFSDFDFITLSFADHDQRLKGKLGILIKDMDSGDTVIYEEIEATSVWSTVPVEISFVEVGGGKADKEYEISLLSSETDNIALGVFGYKTEGEKAMINGEKSEYALSIGIHSYTSLYYYITKVILGVAIIVILFVTICTFKFKLEEENIFLLLAIPFVLCMLMLWPGNAVYDEPRHYHTVYYYSNAFLGCGNQDSYSQIYMRECDVLDAKERKELTTPINAQAQEFHYYVDKMWDKAEKEDMIAVDISNLPIVSDGSFIQYTPGIMGMSIARVLGCNHFWMMTITRLTIIVFYLVLCYYAIHKIPVLKTMIALVAALPMNLYQVSGISYDSFTFAVGIVVFAFIIKLWQSGLEKKDWLVFGIFVFLLGNCKGGVYLTLILLMIFIPKEKYVQKKWLKFASIFSVAGISMLGSYLPTVISWINMSIARTEEVQSASQTIASGEMVVQRLSPMLVISEPIKFIKMFVQTMIGNLDVYLGQMLGYRTAWSNQAIPIVVMLPFLMLIVLAAINKEQERFELEGLQKVGILGILVFELIGMQAIFLIETSVYSETIIGFQGRYFILFLPCILLLFRNESVVYRGKREFLYPLFSMAQFVYLYFFLRMFMLH